MKWSDLPRLTRHLRGILPALCILAGLLCPSIGRADEVPTVNIPPTLRYSNYGTGSCVHASWCMLLEWQNLHDWAAYWRRNYRGGETYSSFREKVDAAGLAYYSTYRQFDVRFLEWACATRRGCMVTCGVYRPGDHMVLLVHLTSTHAGILDNNDVNRVQWVPRNEFLTEWYYSDSWALVPAYTPASPAVK